jgi:hypothetical protein
MRLSRAGHQWIRTLRACTRGFRALAGVQIPLLVSARFGGPPLWRPNSWHGAERIRFPRARYAAVLLDRSRPVPAMKSGIFRNYVADTPIGSRSRSAQPRARSPHRHPRHPYPNPTPRPRSARRYAYHVDRPTPPAANYINGLCSKEGKVRIRTKGRDGDSQGSPLSCARHRGNSSWVCRTGGTCLRG